METLEQQDISFEELSSSQAKATDLEGLQPDYIFLNDGAVGLSTTARCIIDELRDWHKKTEKHGSKSVHPSYLLTLDKLGELLNKYRNLSEQAKSPQSVDQALRQILDFEKKGRNKSALMYPFLVRNGNKVQARIALASPQKEAKTDVTPYRQACFQFSEETIDLILSNRAKKPRILEEDRPGAIILHKNKAGQLWLYPKLASIESEMASLLRRGFHPYHYIPMIDFLSDFVSYAKAKDALTQILPDYHIIIDDLQLNADGTYLHQPEVISHYRAQADGLEVFALTYLKQLSERAGYTLFRSRIQDFESTHGMAEPGRKQNSDKVDALIQLVEDFPFDREKDDLGKRVRETCNLSIQILRKLIEEKSRLSERKIDGAFKSLVHRIQIQIKEHTQGNLALYKFSPEKRLEAVGIIGSEQIANYSETLKKELTGSFGWKEIKKDDGSTEVYAVDPGYMAAVIHKLTADAKANLSYQRELSIAKEINAALSNPKHPDLNSKLKGDHVVKLQQDSFLMEREVEERERTEALAKKFNLSMGLLGFVGTMLFFLIASVHFNTVGIIFVGIPVSLIIGIMLALFFREREKLDLNTGNTKSFGSGFKGEYSNPSSNEEYYAEDSDDSNEHFGKGETPKEKKVSLIAKGAERFVFPNRFTKIQDKIHDAKSLRKKIWDNLDNIRQSVTHLKSEPDDDKVASTVEYALLQNAATIAIPDEIVPPGMPSSIILSHSDLKAPLIRDQLSEFLRNEAQKKKYDKKLVKYYTFLINTIEVEYFKYLPNRKKR
ncbi:hypothetical protein LEP1GSC050_3216 [Leptospira broomii serovar Hurstbridge str. 5399]|uniref:Uncharacterized protein n=1 Tax=Leptospira broomii serovar Hurstbridge str. 5399 TaxID=1049789 RepID=T0FBD5_9LEPT|nr:hypothetical protein [Leptospira broomii]EQA44897.1 hypothetical protein LEP1GSC050_3216 [Leptospira broomii serovar Hurstbridge str. 5399]